jgi:hypothetical protein
MLGKNDGEQFFFFVGYPIASRFINIEQTNRIVEGCKLDGNR